MQQNNDKQSPTEEPGAGKQTDLAEGELETVEESIRIHEEKGDLQPPDSKSKETVKNT